MDIDLDNLRQRLEQASRLEDQLERRLCVLSVVTDAVSDLGIRPVLVGGAAVEFYTLGGYATRDIDIVMPGLASIDQVLADLGFRREGRYRLHDDTGTIMEMPAPPLAGDESRVARVEVGGSVVYVIGLEDLIIDRLNAFVHWRSGEDGRWAERLAMENAGDIDWAYLGDRAVQEKVADAFEEIRRKAGFDR